MLHANDRLMSAKNNKDPERDPNFDNRPYISIVHAGFKFWGPYSKDPTI